MPKKNAINRIIIFFAVFILCLSAVSAWASIFQGLAERLDLFRDRNWVYNNVGEPDSVSWNTTFKAELEMYRISGSSYFDWYFVSYGPWIPAHS